MMLDVPDGERGSWEPESAWRLFERAPVLIREHYLRRGAVRDQSFAIQQYSYVVLPSPRTIGA